ncbi:hypothetical protein [Bifidobacterium asteroides]|uniref:hypothetical protein n=1 Tax=Bifidobacterium asteroides TaxID=1684 RepID=UPI0020C4892B|nr:hypothetical protein [Bifidobacterium asteroides]MCP8613892.1 hypothetical protein [Bifidobacterium asteroides]MCX8687682.1 hypothetical protein [Bifidobacterium sp. B4142]
MRGIDCGPLVNMIELLSICYRSALSSVSGKTILKIVDVIIDDHNAVASMLTTQGGEQ